MATFILTWDGSESGYAASQYTHDVDATKGKERVIARWSVGSRKTGMTSGDRVFLLRQGQDRGIVAGGHVTSGDIYEEAHWNDATRLAQYVDVAWDRVLRIDDRIPIEEILEAVPEHKWNSIYSSGQQVQPPSDAQLETAWATHITAVDDPGWTVRPGDVLSRAERGRRYGGSTYGGIQPSASSSNVFLYSDPTAGAEFGYNYDGWAKDGSVLLYTGEGSVGPQRMRAGNAAIMQHRSAARALRLFVADGTEPDSATKVQRYVGEFRIDGDHPWITAEAPDVNGDARPVIVFRLLPVGRVLRRPEDQSISGDVAAESIAAVVPVDAVVPTQGQSEAVPVEALTATTFPVSGSTGTTAAKREAELSKRYQSHLESLGRTCVRYRVRPPDELRDIYTDIFDQTENVLYEAKGNATREAVRMALGQLLDYSRHISSAPQLAVLLPAAPSTDLLDLLARNKIRCVYETSPSYFITSIPEVG